MVDARWDRRARAPGADDAKINGCAKTESNHVERAIRQELRMRGFDRDSSDWSKTAKRSNFALEPFAESTCYREESSPEI
jgi:hypothetical protein